ncbi:sulfotransferase [Phenylobacterium sp. LjRoot225]|uniref:sulfotransferase family protein n=1 Tax=Phenylobacterium sp. LjRoot225 TaxID=3342285 RepID=UPI003ECF94D4
MNAVVEMNTPPLDAAAILAEARARTGLNDFGDDSLPERFRLAVESIKQAGMDAAGERAAVENCLWLLTSRLEFFEDRKRYPIGEEQITAPVFATGEPRCGTTLLHALLSVDPNGRSLRFWEVMYPSPPPGLTGEDDPRRARADEDWREINTKLAFWLRSHPYNDMLGEGLPEDERTWAFDFRVMTPTAWWRVPMGMKVAGLPTDAWAQYRLHKMMLQQLQYARPKKYWVLKGFHNARLDAFFETYPDARMIWTHRDPVQVIASRIAMVAELMEGLSGHVDWPAVAKQQLAMARASFEATMTHPLVNDPRIHHVRYQDFVRDPVCVIRGFYETYGMAFGADTEAAMRDYLANNKGDRYGKFVYSTDMIGEDIEALNAEFAPYRERFGIDIEHRKPA